MVTDSPVSIGLAPSKRLTRIEAALWQLASRKWACIIAFAVIPLAIRLALLPWIPPPQPGIEDEFSNLLAGDTFASGRLANQPHAFWVFFESVHIIQQPTYMSKYPPLTGLILAFGQWAFGHPWIGILISLGVLCGTLAWAMQNWLPPFWALIGTAIAVLKIGILSYWSESYWGGTGAAIGGTLLIGSLPLLIRRPSFRRGMTAAIGIALLANSRPFEGLLLTVLCLGYVAWQRKSVTSLVAPLLIVMAPVGAWMAFYDLRVTGSALLMPYIAHDRQYVAAPAFLWQKPAAVPTYRHETLRRVWADWDLKRRVNQRENFFITRLFYLAGLEQFYLGIPLAIVIVAGVPAMLKRRRTQAAVWLTILFLAGLSLELGFLPQYAAPATVLFYIVAAGALRTLRYWRTGRPWMAHVVYGAVLVAVGAQLTVALFLPEHRFFYDKRAFQAERAGILKVLNGEPGKQLVFVRYGPNHNINEEWVYNRADIDRSAVVWARSMGQEKDLALISYFKGRHVWLLDEDGRARLSPYHVSDD